MYCITHDEAKVIEGLGGCDHDGGDYSCVESRSAFDFSLHGSVCAIEKVGDI